jgi:hypothetical protein
MGMALVMGGIGFYAWDELRTPAVWVSDSNRREFLVAA